MQNPSRGRLISKQTQDKLKRLLRSSKTSGSTVPDLKPSTIGIVFRNDSGETCPAYACLKVTGTATEGGRYIAVIDKPDGAGGPFLFNGPSEVPSGERGLSQPVGVVKAYYTSGSVVVGDTWGPSTGWNVTSTGDAAIEVYGAIETNELLMGNMAIAQGGTGSKLIFIKAPSGGIPPRASNLLGSATCDKYVINNTGQLEDSTDDVTVVNWATTAVCANGLRYGVAAYIDNNWVVVSEDCGDESGPVQPQAGQYTSGTILSSFPDVESTVLPDFGSFTSGSHTRSTNITGGFE